MALGVHIVDKNVFLDRPKLQKWAQQKHKRAFNTIGRVIQLVDQRSQRSGKSYKKVAEKNREIEEKNMHRPPSKKLKTRSVIFSEPGQPPRYHFKTLRALTGYAYDARTESVVAGPRQFDTPNSQPKGQRTGAALIELGGKYTLHLRSKKTGKRLTKTLEMKARPHTQPAFKTAMQHRFVKQAYRSAR